MRTTTNSVAGAGLTGVERFYLIGIAASEAADRNSAPRRAAAGARAGREVQADRNRVERETVDRLLKRLRKLRGELSAVLLSGASTEFRRFTASQLIERIDLLIAQAKADINALSTRAYRQALTLGVSSVDEPITAARFSIASAPSLDSDLVTAASEVTADLLSVPMQQFRNNLAQRIRRIATAGETQQTQIRGLATAIDDAGFSGASFNAERQIRTELGRVFTGSNYDRMVSLAGRMPFIRKAWRRTKDNRTRLGHVEAGTNYGRGKGIKVQDRFSVNVYQERDGTPPKLLGSALLRFPIDPDATPAGKLAAGATIMCRCSTFLDFDLADLNAFAPSRSTSKAGSDGLTYRYYSEQQNGTRQPASLGQFTKQRRTPDEDIDDGTKITGKRRSGRARGRGTGTNRINRSGA